MNGAARAKWSWCLFDFANSAFPTIALTAFGGPYFQSVLVGEQGIHLLGLHLSSTAAWGFAISVSMALVTVSAPFTGAIADRAQNKQKFLAFYVALGVTATASLAFVAPGSGGVAFWVYVVANFAFEGAYVFYNAFLPELTTSERVGRLSGRGWALGYAGGLCALVLVKPLVPSTYTVAEAGQGSMIYLVVAIWYLLFSFPALLFLRDSGVPEPPAEGYVRATLGQLRETFRALKVYRVVALFLVAYFLYNDALTTVIEFVGVFTKDVLQFSPADNITLFLVLNLVAAPGALLFGTLVDTIGGRRCIAITLVLWIVVVIGAAVCQTKGQFWGVAALAAIVLGATQASSRALMAKLAPRHRMAEFMGLLAFSGKASAVMGPLLYGVTVQISEPRFGTGDANRIAVLVIGSFFVIALFVMLRVDEERGEKQALNLMYDLDSSSDLESS